MGLAMVAPPGTVADTWCDSTIQKIHVETDMQNAVAGFHPLDHAPDQDGDAEFIDLPHVGDRDVALAHQILLQRVDRAGAEQIELRGFYRRPRLIAQYPVEAGLAAQESRHHAVHVSGHRGGRRVVVGMGVEPQHEHLTALFVPMAGNAVDRPH